MREEFERKLHSEEYFGETRDSWWNPDYLELLAKRWRLSEATSVLDVGSGLGHWGRLLGTFLPVGARVVGIDSEEQWVADASKRPQSTVRFEYHVGDAGALPFPDAHFDVVTCQTLLIHVAEPLRVLQEMLRVARPGGLLLLAEPNNLSASLACGSSLVEKPMADVVDLFRFQLTCERGKAGLGEGDNSVGERGPGLLAQAGAIDIEVRQSDKAFFMIPPYIAPEEQARAQETQTFAARDFWIWDRHDTERYFMAAGGTSADFSRLWELALREVRATAEAIRTKTYHAAGGGSTYLVWGRKRD